MQEIFKIAVLQARSVPGRCMDNAREAARAMEQAKREKADLLLLPECFLSGYRFPLNQAQVLSPQSPPVQLLCEQAKRLSIGVVATAFTQGAARPRNTAFLIGRQGEILMQYDKVHTCDFSFESALENGEEFRVCDFCGVKIGLMICYDREYPESARMLMLKGAEIIIVPNDCGGMPPRLCALQTRAYENMVGVVMANPPGESAGNSCAYQPYAWDEQGYACEMELFCAPEKATGLFYAVYDLARLRAYRADEMMGNTFRKVSAYDGLLDAQVRPPFVRERGDGGL